MDLKNLIGFQDKAVLSKIDFKNPATWVATWFGCGLMRPGPGTWGTLGGLPFGIFLMMAGGIPALILGLIIVLPLGFWASGKFDAMAGTHDSGMIVIDEVAGLWITLLAATATPFSVLLAFVFFRVFDIWKPWPVSWLDQKLTGPLSVMADDVMAGIYAALCLIGLRYAGFG